MRKNVHPLLLLARGGDDWKVVVEVVAEVLGMVVALLPNVVVDSILQHLLLLIVVVVFVFLRPVRFATLFRPLASKLFRRDLSDL